MSIGRLTALVPCRSGSKRVPGKNTRPFMPHGESLLSVKLGQLSELGFVDEIIVSTDDPDCIEIAKARLGSEIVIDHRPPRLAQDDTSLSELTEHLGAIAGGEQFLWTHVTSPFFSSVHYEEAHKVYSSQAISGHRSLMAVEKINDFIWFSGQPLNFGSDDEFWPRSQDLTPAFRVTSGLFMGPTALLRDSRNRISADPLLFEVRGPVALDIDWPDDFEEAMKLVRRDPALVN